MIVRMRARIMIRTVIARYYVRMAFTKAFYSFVMWQHRHLERYLNGLREEGFIEEGEFPTSEAARYFVADRWDGSRRHER